MTARRLSLVACVLAFAVGPAAAHTGVPQGWWLDEPTALHKVRALERARWKPSAYKGFRGRCRGLGPTAVRRGRSIYKHFACTSRVRISTVTFSFAYRVHVVGKGRIALGD